MNETRAKPPSGRDGAGGPPPPPPLPPLPKPVVLIGLMGAGKTRVGRALAERIGVGFADSDDAIVEAAGMDIAAIFEAYGEDAFRDLEARVLAGMLDGGARVISTGGGAFMREETRSLITDRAISLWLKAEPATLAKRISNPDSRPLLRGRDAVAVLEALAAERHPVYAGADLAVDTDGLELDDAVDRVDRELARFLQQSGAGARP